MIIALHACLKYSERVGRSAATRRLDAAAVELAVNAHIRHAETEYDDLLAKGYERWEARERVRGTAERIMGLWKKLI
jgi:hypothetical protein